VAASNAGSGYLIMMIMGGGFISLLQRYVADEALLGHSTILLGGCAVFCLFGVLWM
jgi:FHS family L-fucose permease-like MFS transporter